MGVLQSDCRAENLLFHFWNSPKQEKSETHINEEISNFGNARAARNETAGETDELIKLTAADSCRVVQLNL